MLFKYDDSDEQSILQYAKKLENRTFRDILNEFEKSKFKSYDRFKGENIVIEEDESTYLVNKKAKGELGNFLERYYFGYKPNGKQEADFPKVGIELKQTCIDVKKNGDYTAGERLSITNISFEKPVEDDFFKSHVWNKTRLMLLIHYLRDKSKERLDYEILFANLFTPPEEDLKIIIEDYRKINEKIKSGLAHELSEGDTLYLGACTKGSTAAKIMRPQYYGDHTLAKKRNFCFKRSYMDYILHTYVLKEKVPYESIIKNDEVLYEQSFENYVIEKINTHIGKSDFELCKKFDREYNVNKAQWVDLTYRMLGIKGNHAKEFVKAGIVLKTIRLEENSKIKEHMSFAPFKFKEFVQEEWETSKIYNYFSETRFLFVVYQKKGEYYYLQGASMWNMPLSDLNTIVYDGWKNIQECIRNGVEFKKSGKKMLNNLPKPSDNPIIHIRPHASKAAYLLHNGYTQGNVEKDADELPNGEWMTRQSFWINNEYILKQLKFKKK